MMEIFESVIDDAVVVQSFETKLIRKDEAIGEVSQNHPIATHGSRSDAVKVLRSEEPELVFRETIETLTVEIIHVDADSLKLRQVEALRERGTVLQIGLLIVVELGQVAPWTPGCPFGVTVEAGQRGAPTGVLRVDLRVELERAGGDDEIGSRIGRASIEEVIDAEGNVDLAELQERMASAEVETRAQRPYRLALHLLPIAENGVVGRNGDAEKVDAQIRPRVSHVRVRGIGREHHAGQEHVGLNPAVLEIEIEVVDAAQRHHPVLQSRILANAPHHATPPDTEP